MSYIEQREDTFNYALLSVSMSMAVVMVGSEYSLPDENLEDMFNRILCKSSSILTQVGSIDVDQSVDFIDSASSRYGSNSRLVTEYLIEDSKSIFGSDSIDQMIRAAQHSGWTSCVKIITRLIQDESALSHLLSTHKALELLFRIWILLFQGCRYEGGESLVTARKFFNERSKQPRLILV